MKWPIENVRDVFPTLRKGMEAELQCEPCSGVAEPFVFHLGSSAPSEHWCSSAGCLLLRCRPSRLCEDLYIICNPFMTGLITRKDKDLWDKAWALTIRREEIPLHWCLFLGAAHYNVLNLKSDPDNGGQAKRNHNSHWCESTYWKMLKHSSSFNMDGTCNPSAIKSRAGFPFCINPSVIWLLINKSESPRILLLAEGFWAWAKMEPEANVRHWPNCGIMKRGPSFAYTFVTKWAAGRQLIKSCKRVE